ncbi:GNAT family N-acetyltransferase [Pseudoalteromonas luteoviolacea]|uniref:GNAT family N-acetyltransferase n=1 Tax=Pseudoalteromonas luteoviolacea TaxID=43657 RepID=UPI001B39DA87|nr:GNAT family N-acetyltransferase [Pseudoalteromonas luteoviolacea]MBQ4879976.1 GNAT family N-acetyltransferase [Pseudoalteromonas luteoviolacea]MBQ4908993.1 GNAT family N-acetyltransferase [Pseudoalteromonas luteoviolacea]
MEYKEVKSSDVPIELLLEADPSKDNILSYLQDAWCFVAVDVQQIVGACVVSEVNCRHAEIYNMSVVPNRQGKGLGTQLLVYVIAQLKSKKIERVELGTGTFGYQLTYYQRLGFRVECVVKNYFLQNYSEPIFENGIQHKDMLRLYLNLI